MVCQDKVVYFMFEIEQTPEKHVNKNDNSDAYIIRVYQGFTRKKVLRS